ncbi:MAG: dockerin type I repeat-containing protein, partial [Clostridia bacterium]|nr:dockerin type I repeat-containing protein [Clostridia bacterium]
YVDNKEGALTFKIPVYSSMPEKVYDAPSIENMPNTGGQEQPGQGGTTAGKKGDISGDGIVNGKDMAILKSYLLGLRTLTSEEKNYADVSGDKEVNGKDLAIIKMYLLGNRTL